jgi:hypothetical protein
MRFTDPTGMYLCAGSPEDCAQFSLAYGEVGKALEALPEDAEDRGRLQAIVDFYGEEGVENGAEVTFGQIASGAPAEAGFRPGNRRFFGLGRRTQGTSVIKFDLEQMDSIAEFAGRISHEGSHGIDQQSNNAQVTLRDGLASEYRAYWAQSATYRGLRFESSYRLWSVRSGHSISDITMLAVRSMRLRCSQLPPGTGGCP